MKGCGVQVFIQNEAGSNQKNYHDEKTLAWQPQSGRSSSNRLLDVLRLGARQRIEVVLHRLA